MKRIIKGLVGQFIVGETGAVTVDWVVLTAAIIGLGVAVSASVGAGSTDLSVDIANELVECTDGANTDSDGNSLSQQLALTMAEEATARENYYNDIEDIEVIRALYIAGADSVTQEQSQQAQQDKQALMRAWATPRKAARKLAATQYRCSAQFVFESANMDQMLADAQAEYDVAYALHNPYFVRQIAARNAVLDDPTDANVALFRQRHQERLEPLGVWQEAIRKQQILRIASNL